jgi:Tol biopolymer transport system component
MRIHRIFVCVLVLLYGCSHPPEKTGTPVKPKERIAYSSLRASNWDVYYFAKPGTPPRRLTDSPGLDYDAVFSPDGRWVVFTSERRGNPDLYAIDLQQDGVPTPHLLIDSAAMEDQAAFSPAGDAIAFVSTASGNADIYTIRFDPSLTQTIDKSARLTQDTGGDFRPSFSPDGMRIAFSTDRDTPPYGHPSFSFTRQRVGEIYVMDRDGKNAQRLTNSPGWDGSPKWSADGQTIYFYSERPRELPGPPTSPILGQEGGFRIWSMRADGSNAKPVTPAGVEALAPAIAPDGRIAFQMRNGVTDWKIKSVAANGVDIRFESDESNNYWNADFNAKTRAMVCHGVGPGTVKTQAVEEVLGPGPLLAPDFPASVELPDRTIALYAMRHTSGFAAHPRSNSAAVTIEDQSGTRLVLVNFDGSGEREIFTIPGIGIVASTFNRVSSLSWSSDGGRLAYTQGAFFGQTTGKSDVWVMRSDGSERVNLTDKIDANDGLPAFSPDGKKLVFRSSRSGHLDLFTMNTDGSELRQLTNDAAVDTFPVFSPSGDAIAFTSDRDGEADRFGYRTTDIYLMQLKPDGSAGDIRRLTTSTGHDAHPFYSPDGKWIVYTSEQGGISDEEPLVQEVVFGPQMYGELFAYRLSDGLTVRLTHNKWEEGVGYWGPEPEQRLNERRSSS